MNTKPENKDLTLMRIVEQFPTDEKAREYLESVRWKDGIACPHCRCADQSKFSAIKSNSNTKVRPGLRYCSACGKQFTVTVGTIFEDSHIPLRKWLIAWYLICSSKKGISSLQLQRLLELGSYRTALFMAHRIRYALRDPAFSDKLKGTVEADETWVGGERKHVGPGYKENKAAAMAIVERGGSVRSQVMPRVTGKNLKTAIRENVERCSRLMTDDHHGYRGLDWEYYHDVVKHTAGEYVRGDAHTNTVESNFSLLKRGVMGTFHSVSRKHLPLYLAEFDHRWNHRKTTDGQRTDAGLRKVSGRRLTYRQLTAKRRLDGPTTTR